MLRKQQNVLASIVSCQSTQREDLIGQRMSSRSGRVMQKKRVKRVHEGEYVAEVEVTLTDFDQPWGPYLENQDVLRLDAVRSALRNGNVQEAAKYGRVFRLIP